MNNSTKKYIKLCLRWLGTSIAIAIIMNLLSIKWESGDILMVSGFIVVFMELSEDR